LGFTFLSRAITAFAGNEALGWRQTSPNPIAAAIDIDIDTGEVVDAARSASWAAKPDRSSAQFFTNLKPQRHS